MSDAGQTATLLALLERHYIKPSVPLPGGIFLPEVGQNGAWGASSRVDAIYVGFTSTSGRILVGHELKVSRSDWLHELDQPGKADAWADQCHEWYLVTVPGVVQPGELPDGWGLMLPNPRTKTRMKIEVKARRKPESHVPSWDAVRSIMARQDTLRQAAITRASNDIDRKAWAEIDRRVEQRVEQALRHQPDTAALRRRIERYEDALGRLAPEDREAYGREISDERLADMANLLSRTKSIDEAMKELSGRYSSLPRVQEALDELRTAIDALASTEGARP